MDRLHDRLAGALVGLAVGDAAGVLAASALTTRTGGRSDGGADWDTSESGGAVGPFDRRPGAWTDATSMALCLGTSLLESGGFDVADQMRRYLRWWREGFWTATGRCLDIGVTTRQALSRFEKSGNPQSGNPDPRTAGNGSLIRLAPLVIWAHRRPMDALDLARESSRPTHAAAVCIDACEYLAGLLILAWSGADLNHSLRTVNHRWSPEIRRLALTEFAPNAPFPWQPTDYVVDTLACARWIMAQSGSFQQAIGLAAALDGAPRAIGAVTGQLAGARWGLAAIPPKWVARLVMSGQIQTMARRLAEEGPQGGP